MKNLKHKEKNKDNQIAKEEKKRLDREKARIKRKPYHDEKTKEDNKTKIEEKIKKKRLDYEKGILSKSKYLEWLVSDKKKEDKK